MNIQNNYDNDRRWAGTWFCINLVRPNKILDLCDTWISSKLWEILYANNFIYIYMYISHIISVFSSVCVTGSIWTLALTCSVILSNSCHFTCFYFSISTIKIVNLSYLLSYAWSNGKVKWGLPKYFVPLQYHKIGINLLQPAKFDWCVIESA